MKQNQLITKTLVVVALLLVGSSSTYAQFGNLLNRAKNAAKREAVKQANDAQWEAKNKALREVNEKKREELFVEIKEKAKAYAICAVSPEEIDEINILEATKKAMRTCVKELASKGQSPDILLIDAVNLSGTGLDVIPIIKGDAKSDSIAAASILAKVTRDHMMIEYDEQYPGYGFAKHKGYGTKDHYAAIREKGMTPIHRRSFLKVIH